MPINGICHDFALTRCFPADSKTSTPTALTDKDLWKQVQIRMEKVDPGKIDALGKGVLTVADPLGQVAHCSHSYYVGDNAQLISTNDPFVGNLLKKMSIQEEYGVQAITYPAKDLISVMKGVTELNAKIGDDPRSFSFYWCSEAVARLGWWAGK